MQNALLKGEEQETDIAGLQVPTELASPNRLVELASRWQTLAQEMAKYGAPPQAGTLRQCSKELFEIMKAEKEVLLNLTAAAQLCGYSADTLGRQIREGKLTSYGPKGSPKVRRGDLPKKPRAVVALNSGGYSPNADARSILSRGRRAA